MVVLENDLVLANIHGCALTVVVLLDDSNGIDNETSVNILLFQ